MRNTIQITLKWKIQYSSLNWRWDRWEADGLFMKGYSVPTIKHVRRYEALTEYFLAYLLWHRAVTSHCHIVPLSLSILYSMHHAVSYRSFSVTLHIICKLNNERRNEGGCYCLCGSEQFLLKATFFLRGTLHHPTQPQTRAHFRKHGSHSKRCYRHIHTRRLQHLTQSRKLRAHIN